MLPPSKPGLARLSVPCLGDRWGLGGCPHLSARQASRSVQPQKGDASGAGLTPWWTSSTSTCAAISATPAGRRRPRTGLTAGHPVGRVRVWRPGSWAGAAQQRTCSVARLAIWSFGGSVLSPRCSVVNLGLWPPASRGPAPHLPPEVVSGTEGWRACLATGGRGGTGCSLLFDAQTWLAVGGAHHRSVHVSPSTAIEHRTPSCKRHCIICRRTLSDVVLPFCGHL